MVWSSQTGFARELAERSAEALRGAGVPVRVRGLHEVDATLLVDSQRALFIASTTGEGDPPDHALPFLRGVMTSPPALQHLQYGVLALGDRSYGHFCGFGHQLDQWLRQHGAHPLFDAITCPHWFPWVIFPHCWRPCNRSRIASTRSPR